MSAEYEEQLRFSVKAELRKRMRGLRKLLPLDARVERSRAIVERLRALPAFERARTVAAFVAIKGEVDVSALLTFARAAGKTVLLPRVDAEREELALHVFAEGDLLEPSGFGVPEPRADAPVIAPHDVDLVIVPGLVFDERGHRIGYGAGFYDKLLPRLPGAVTVGVAYDFQLVAEVPNTAGDVAVALIVTDARVVEAEGLDAGGAPIGEPLPAQ